MSFSVSLSLLCKSKFSIGLLFLVFFPVAAGIVYSRCMRLFHDDDCAFDPAPRALERVVVTVVVKVLL
jgi:hypothetical protein